MFDESRYISKRRLRSHKKMEKEFMYEIGMTAPSSPMDCKFVSRYRTPTFGSFCCRFEFSFSQQQHQLRCHTKHIAFGTKFVVTRLQVKGNFKVGDQLATVAIRRTTETEHDLWSYPFGKADGYKLFAIVVSGTPSRNFRCFFFCFVFS